MSALWNLHFRSCGSPLSAIPRGCIGYPLDPSMAILPRGIGLVEEVIRSGEAVTFIEPGACGRLAHALGIPELPSATALIPLGRSGAVVGALVADREGEEVRGIADFALLLGRLGGVFGMKNQS